MPFKVTARTILQLGAELISSDAIAFYELIKNAFDAGSEYVNVRVVIRIDSVLLRIILTTITGTLNQSEKIKKQVLGNVLLQLKGQIDTSSYNHESLRKRIENSRTLEDLYEVLLRANYIQFIDTGEGMSLDDLDEIYLTVGTPSRKNLKNLPQNVNGREHTDIGVKRHILGEKGLGRLSVMRLGEIVRVKSTKKGEAKFNILEIDWSIFLKNSDSPLESIELKPIRGDQKENKNSSGTTITIYNLNAVWSEKHLIDITKSQLSKFIDPFSKKNRDFMILWYNKEPVVTTNIHKLLFDNAHAHCVAKLEFVNGQAVLKGNVDYKLFNKSKNFILTEEHLTSPGMTTAMELKSLGPFEVVFYWFNNLIVKAIDGIGKMKDVRALIKDWAGGLMVYRDGFRIFPYGSFEDDWLQLDDVAFSSGGYKVNRRQVVGKVDISAIKNPKLVDQTNREGLRDCPEKQLLIQLLQHIMWTEFKAFLQVVEKDRLTNDPLDINELEDRLLNNEAKLLDNLNFLLHRFPEIKKEKSAIQGIRDSLVKSRNIFADAKTVMESYEQRESVTLHLAGLGLMVDIVAHELNRSTKHALDTINHINDEDLSKGAQGLISNLQIQLQSLNTRLKVLDPLGPSGRNVKSTFSLINLVNETVDFHKNQFKRHGISCNVVIEGSKEWKIKAVQGMILQILENLISNSVYWLKARKLNVKNFHAEINIKLIPQENMLLFTDNGPGIPVERKEEVFFPFFTTKPPGDGKGLGLYLSKEIAKYHNVDFYLIEEKGKKNLNTFSLDLNPVK
jgi:signal transduction histidine kinase